MGLLSCVTIYFKSRPTEYRPNEQSADITSSLARQLPSEAPVPHFIDVTAAAGLARFRNFAGDRTSQLPEDMGPGLAWGDFDNDGTFDEVSAALNVQNPQGRSLGALWQDFDDDGRLDLYVANDISDNVLFHNTGGRFEDISHPALVADYRSAMGLASGDYNRDNDEDLFITHWLAQENALYDNLWTDFSSKPAESDARKLLSPLRFMDVNEMMGLGQIALQFVGWGTEFADFDGDGWLDLIVANGNTVEFPGAYPKKLKPQEPFLFWNWYENLDVNATYELTEGEATPRKIVPERSIYAASQPFAASETNYSSAGGEVSTPKPAELRAPGEKSRQLEFWKKQRAAMNAMKVEKDNPRAIILFRDALALDPDHEDSRYYLGRCLASEGDIAGAFAQLDALKRINPQSHRAWQQWGVLRALFATNTADLDAAEHSLERAQAINPEETGALLVLGEISLLRGDLAKADERLAAACRTNPKAVGGLFLRGYIAWKRGDEAQAIQQLESMRIALGKEWQPKGATCEGDVTQKQHVELTPLRHFSENWDGSLHPESAFANLDSHLNGAQR